MGASDSYGLKSKAKPKPKTPAMDSYGLAQAFRQYAAPRPTTPLASAFSDYADRVGGDFRHGLDESAKGFGEMLQGQFSTGIPRTVLGGLGWMGSPVSGAVSPILSPILEPVAGGIHDYVGKPIEQATGYPADLTTEIALAAMLPKALHGAGKVVNHSVPYLASLGDAVGKHIGAPEGSYMAGPLPLNRYKAAGLRSQLDPLEASLKKALLAKDATQAAKIREKLNGVRSEISRLDPGVPALDSAASDAILANHLDQSPISSPVGGEIEQALKLAYENNRGIPDGWYVHGRADAADLSNHKWPAQLTRKFDVMDQYAGKRGSGWALKPKDDAITLDLSSPETPNSRALAAAAIQDFRNGKLPFSEDISHIDRKSLAAEIIDSFAPKRIVDSAQAYDNPEWTGWLVDRFQPDFVKTPDGGISLNHSAMHQVRLK